LVDADQIAKDCLVKGESCYQKVLETFGREILRSDGEIERSKLREIVVKDEVALTKLNSLIHPEVEAVIVEKIKDERKCFLLDVPLLFEAGLDKLCDLTIFVNTHEKVRRKRLIARGTMPLKEAAKLNSSLLEAIKKMAKVDVIIDNSLTREATDFQVKSLIEKIRQLNLISK
jgi:dephospho-CoA kinase